MKFYRLTTAPDKELIEYSTSFSFFIKHQIGVAHSSTGTSFYSKLESKLFLHSTEPKDIFTDKRIELLCAGIHSRILTGYYGAGKIVN